MMVAGMAVGGFLFFPRGTEVFTTVPPSATNHNAFVAAERAPLAWHCNPIVGWSFSTALLPTEFSATAFPTVLVVGWTALGVVAGGCVSSGLFRLLRRTTAHHDWLPK